MDGLELLPDADGLELLPETDSLMDSLPDPAAPVPRWKNPPPTQRLVAASTSKRNVREHFWKDPVKLFTVIVPPILGMLAVEGIRQYFSHSRQVKQRVVKAPVTPDFVAPAPYFNPGLPPATANNGAAPAAIPIPTVNSKPVGGSTPAATAMIGEATSVLSMQEHNVRLVRQISDNASAERLGGEWAVQFIDAIDAAERLDRFKGQIVTTTDKTTYETILDRCENQLTQLEAHITQLANMSDVQATLAAAFEKAFKERPYSAFAQALRSHGQATKGMMGLARKRAEMQAHSDARRKEGRNRMEQMKAESDARMEQMKADSEAQINEMRERSRMRNEIRDNIRNRHFPGQK